MTKQILESSKQEHFRIAVLDDYQHVALSLADWSVLDGRATVTVFDDHLADSDAVVERLQPFDIVCVMRERTPMTPYDHRALAQAPPDRLDGAPECLDRSQGCRRAGRAGRSYGLYLGAVAAGWRSDGGGHSGRDKEPQFQSR
jgi:hypothetical protein